MSYSEKLRCAVTEAESCLCVGLDPHPELLPPSLHSTTDSPAERAGFFLKRVIELTAPHCAAFKPNLAFFESMGRRGLDILGEVIEAIPPGKIVIADAKRGDIGSTAAHYAKAWFEQFAVDALTVSPLLGFETLEPFAGYPEKALYVLTLTSNPGADDFFARPFAGEETMAAYIAGELARRQDAGGTALGMVLGATRPRDLRALLSAHPTAPLLLPGVGSQGGSISDLVEVLAGHRGIPLVSSSRSILFAGGKEENWEESVAAAAQSYREQLQPITASYV
ncbi:MAG: orotidine-5'-phosphate decarboxylase [Balneolaceae bacterium]|nr:orotidine-5'-phosphate decarboxylase [Balneolaceae bacterium]